MHLPPGWNIASCSFVTASYGAQKSWVTFCKASLISVFPSEWSANLRRFQRITRKNKLHWPMSEKPFPYRTTGWQLQLCHKNCASNEIDKQQKQPWILSLDCTLLDKLESRCGKVMDLEKKKQQWEGTGRCRKGKAAWKSASLKGTPASWCGHCEAPWEWTWPHSLCSLCRTELPTPFRVGHFLTWEQYHLNLCFCYPMISSLK